MKSWKDSEFRLFIIQEEKKKKTETWPVVIFRGFKNIVQYIIGLSIFSLVIYEICIKAFGVNFPTSNQYMIELINMPILEMVSIGLAAATALELAYMLFTPGPDEAIQPVMMGIASFVLYALSTFSPDTSGVQLIGIALLVLCIPVLFWTKQQFEKSRET